MLQDEGISLSVTAASLKVATDQIPGGTLAHLRLQFVWMEIFVMHTRGRTNRVMTHFPQILSSIPYAPMPDFLPCFQLTKSVLLSLPLRQ